jgi:hypothetical protein
VRNSALLRANDNRSAWLAASYAGVNAVRSYFEDALALDLRWRDDAPRRSMADTRTDLCGAARPSRPAYGAFEDLSRCASAAPR